MHSTHNHALRSTPTRWQTVMFDPLAYIHADRLHLSDRFDTPAQRAAINRMLIGHYRLTSTPLPQSQAHAAELLLKHWMQLPEIIFLLGCQRLRFVLSRRGLLLRLPASVQKFMTLPLLPSAAVGNTKNGAPPDRNTLLWQGMQQLRLSLGQWPTALAQRIPLLFGPVFDHTGATEYDEADFVTSQTPAGTSNDAARDPAHALILTMAIQHVKRYPASA